MTDSISGNEAWPRQPSGWLTRAGKCNISVRNCNRTCGKRYTIKAYGAIISKAAGVNGGVAFKRGYLGWRIEAPARSISAGNGILNVARN